MITVDNCLAKLFNEHYINIVEQSSGLKPEKIVCHNEDFDKRVELLVFFSFAFSIKTNFLFLRDHNQIKSITALFCVIYTHFKILFSLMVFKETIVIYISCTVFGEIHLSTYLLHNIIKKHKNHSRIMKIKNNMSVFCV